MRGVYIDAKPARALINTRRHSDDLAQARRENAGSGGPGGGSPPLGSGAGFTPGGAEATPDDLAQARRENAGSGGPGGGSPPLRSPPEFTSGGRYDTRRGLQSPRDSGTFAGTSGAARASGPGNLGGHPKVPVSSEPSVNGS
jgi:hypothetical protein